MERTFYTVEVLLDSVEPYFVQDGHSSAMTTYSKADVIRVAKAYAKEMAKQVLWEADGGFEQNTKGYIPQKKFNEVLRFINEQ